MLNALSEHSFKIKFGHAQSTLPKISILMWKAAFINPCWIYKNISDNAVKINFSNQPYMYNLPSRVWTYLYSPFPILHGKIFI